MKKLILIIIIFTSLNSIAQKKTNIFFVDFVECFYSDKATEPISIHNSPNGNKITELSPLTEPHCWYKFAISESKDGWLKIENIIVLPACEENELNKDIEKFKGKWILVKNMEINLPDITKESEIKMNFYESPDKNSNIVYTSYEFLSTQLIEVDGTWAKLSFEKNGEKYFGWLERKYQCPYPWTTCPVWD